MTNLELLHQLIDNHYKTYEVLKRKYGVIKKVLSYEKAIVTIENSDMLGLQKKYKSRSPDEEDNIKAENGDVILLNMTGEELKNGDPVWIHYWTTVVSGYIAIKNGGLKHNTGGNSLTVQNLAVLTAEQGNLYAHAKKYDLSSEWGSDYENTKWKENYDSRLMSVDKSTEIEIVQGEESHGYNTIFTNGNPVLIMRSGSVVSNDIKLVNPNFFTHEMNVRTAHNITKCEFNSSGGISTSTYSLDPNRDSKLFLAMRCAETRENEQAAFFSVMIEQDNIENTILDYGSYYLLPYIPLAFERLKFILIAWNHNSINAPDSTFPYGSVRTGCLIYNTWNSRYSYWINLTLGFQNNAEYEYAQCVLSSCDFQPIEE